MKVKDLILELQKFDPELIVAVEADHSQTPMKMNGVSEEYVHCIDEYMMESLYVTEDGLTEDNEDPNVIGDKLIILSGY